MPCHAMPVLPLRMRHESWSLHAAPDWGVNLSEVVPGARQPATRFENASEWSPKLLDPLGPWARNFAEALEYIDLDDLAEAAARGTPEPWRLYDDWGKRDMLALWRQARGLGRTDDIQKLISKSISPEKRMAGMDLVLQESARKPPGDPHGYAATLRELLKETPGPRRGELLEAASRDLGLRFIRALGGVAPAAR